MTEFADIKGGRIAYDVTGQGPLAVLSHGIGDHRQVYRFLAPRLAQAGYRVAAADLRGHGAVIYNAAHATPLPAVLIGLGWWQHRPLVLALGLVGWPTRPPPGLRPQVRQQPPAHSPRDTGQKKGSLITPLRLHHRHPADRCRRASDARSHADPASHITSGRSSSRFHRPGIPAPWPGPSLVASDDGGDACQTAGPQARPIIRRKPPTAATSLISRRPGTCRSPRSGETAVPYPHAYTGWSTAAEPTSGPEDGRAR
jgi:hypothetical protein